MIRDRHFDIAVVGAGPTGCAVAAAQARRGARVALLDANPKAAQRFAGEWIHPPGVRVLENLGLLDGFDGQPRGNGFVLFGDDGRDPVELPYPRGLALACEHFDMVHALRTAVSDFDGVTYLPHHQVMRCEPGKALVNDRLQCHQFELFADRIVGADGRSSRVRRALALPDDTAPLSYMASVELRDTELPMESWGHVFLGGPGPALFYRIDGERIRGCLDVPLSWANARDRNSRLAERFAPVVGALAPALRLAVDHGEVRWAINRFRPRAHFGTDALLLAGDAVGHTHPLSAIGLTQGMLDAEALAECTSVERYAQRRGAAVPELLANVLYAVFSRTDASARNVRWGLLDMLRRLPAEQRRTMEILTTEDRRGHSFATAFLRASTWAGSEAVRAARIEGTFMQVPVELFKLVEWLQWPATSVFRSVAPRVRREGTRWDAPLRSVLRAGRLGTAATAVEVAEPSRTTGAGRTDPPPMSVARRVSESGPVRVEKPTEQDWEFCQEALKQVSRTFSEPIGVLPKELQVALTCGYLLCRIADTVEDHVAVPPERRDDLFSTFIAVLELRADPSEFSAPFQAIPGDDAELRLARRIAPVLRVFQAQSVAIREGTLPWVREMADGMRLFTRRPPGKDGVVALLSTADLERYCYFVAGTVGRMITDLFTETLNAPELHAPLARYCEEFGMGLQMVNILKDVTDDLARGWCFIPRDLCSAEGITPAQLADPTHREAAHAAVAPLFERAAAHLDDALTYTLTLPPEQGPLRLFCLLPLWMAVRTLAVARGNDAMFTPRSPVKISRAEVAKLIAECTFHKGNDEALRSRYGALRAELDRRGSEQAARGRAASQLAS